MRILLAILLLGLVASVHAQDTDRTIIVAVKDDISIAGQVKATNYVSVIFNAPDVLPFSLWSEWWVAANTASVWRLYMFEPGLPGEPDLTTNDVVQQFKDKVSQSSKVKLRQCRWPMSPINKLKEAGLEPKGGWYVP